MKVCLSFFIVLFYSTFAMAQYQPLYSNTPNYTAVVNEETISYENGITIVEKVTIPQYQYFRVKEDAVERPCVIICPGGGYMILATSHEGTDLAHFFNSIGINALVLKYRIPNEAAQFDKSVAPLMDAQQAMYLVRSNAKKWGIDENKIGVMGFSAGGHLAASLACHYKDIKITMEQPVSLRPNFQILVYPVITMESFGHAGSKENLLGKNPSQKTVQYFSNELNVVKQTPPAFLVHAKDDELVPIKNSLAYEKSLNKHHVPVTLFTYEKGGHGFGMNNPSSPLKWTEALTVWLKQMKVL